MKKNSFVFFEQKPVKTQKWKKASRGSKLDYGQESKMFLKFIFTANKNESQKASILAEMSQAEILYLNKFYIIHFR